MTKIASKSKKNGPTAKDLMEDLTASWRSRALSTAIEVDVFSQIATGKRTAKEIAAATAASERGMRMLLDALTGMNYAADSRDKIKQWNC